MNQPSSDSGAGHPPDRPGKLLAPAGWPLTIAGVVAIPVISLLGSCFQEPVVALAVCMFPVGVVCSGRFRWGPTVIAASSFLGAAAPLLMANDGTGNWFMVEFLELGRVALGSLILFAFAELTRLLRVAIDHAEMHATTDMLTGLLNQRGFTERLEAELNRSQRTGASLAVAFLDLDAFKRWNDSFGHLQGDRLLAEVSRMLKGSIRRYDSAARWGGDEFVLLFPGTGIEEAKTIAERIQNRLAEHCRSAKISVSCSMGVAVSTGSMTAQALIHAADQLMYDAKRGPPGSIIGQEIAAPVPHAVQD